jgi:hypothetical protein
LKKEEEKTSNVKGKIKKKRSKKDENENCNKRLKISITRIQGSCMTP